MKVSDQIVSFSNSVAFGCPSITFEGTAAICIEKILSLNHAAWICAISFLEIKFTELHSEYTPGYGKLPNFIAASLMSIGSRSMLGKETEAFAMDMGWAAGSLDTLKELRRSYIIKEKVGNRITIVKRRTIND